MNRFTELGLSAPILSAIADEGHESPTPIQCRAIPPILEGKDVLGIAQTGTGKTAAFALPILHRLTEGAHGGARGRRCRVLVLAPTRELAAQVLERFNAYGRRLDMRTALVIGGASIGKQKNAVRSADIIVATPGRLADLMRQNAVDLDFVETLVLDEVDQMLDLGFIHAIRQIAGALPKSRQNVFLSATMPPAIAKLAAGLLRDPVRVEVEAKQRLKIEQGVIFVEQQAKPAALIDIARREGFTRGLVFTRTKRGADRVAKALNAAGLRSSAIHGNRSQSQRERALEAFRKGAAPILVATDIAARGIDVVGVSHVVNYDLPATPETYVHRIGRTARAGAAGAAVSFCTAEERGSLRVIEKLTGERLAVIGGAAAVAERQANAPRRNGDAPHSARNNAKKRRKPHGDRRPDNDNAPLPVFITGAPQNGLADAGEKKGKDHGERGSARVRRRRHRGAAGRQFPRHAG